LPRESGYARLGEGIASAPQEPGYEARGREGERVKEVKERGRRK